MNYLVFAGAHYYPAGGWDDFIGAYNTIEEAREAAAKATELSWVNWWQIVNIRSYTVVESS
jgi:hypothetical protein